MGRQKRTQAIIDAAYEVLEDLHPMTVRQVYYRLVYREFCGLVLENSMSSYKSISTFLVEARKDGTIPWEWIEDRQRQPRTVSMWDGLPDLAKSVLQSYRRNVWATQPIYLEVWLEKDALSGIFMDALDYYGVTLNVGRGYDGWSSIYNAAQRWGRAEDVTVLYFGDFDPSGEDMARSLRDRLGELGSHPEIVKVALTKDLVIQHELPHDFAKKADTRRAAFVEKHGDIAVELDALVPPILRSIVTEEIEKRMDMQALKKVLEQETEERESLTEALRKLAS